MINILAAIHSLKPEYKTANISVTWNDNDTVADMDINWAGVTPISNEDLQAEYDRLIANKVNYIEPRRLSYPSIADQLDDIFHNGIDGWKETIQAIKDKYPKE